MNNKKNFITAAIFQVVHIIYGLVVPRIVLIYFGSDINGLVSSITQFLSFITLLEGGLGAVVLAELFSPIEERENTKVRAILVAGQSLFNKLAIGYVVYTLLLGVIYAFFVRQIFNPFFVISLTAILSLVTLSEYLFSISYKLYLQATQQIYITNIISTVVLLVNTFLVFIAVWIYPEIRLLKFLSAIMFLVQPFILRSFVPKEIKGLNKKSGSTLQLRNRWSGFAQNLAYFINMNTDIVIITVFCSFSSVSVYSVYMLAVNAIRLIICTVANSYQGSLGKYIAQKEKEILTVQFHKFWSGMLALSVPLFCTCLLLINPFVSIYTADVIDSAEYQQPIFALIIIIANLVYCIREPFRLIILAAGRFKETNFGSMMEAIINVILSIVLVGQFGLVGVAIGTLIAIVYRFVYFVQYCKKDILLLSLNSYFPYLGITAVILLLNIMMYFVCPIIIDSIVSFMIWGVGILIIETVLASSFYYCLYKYCSKRYTN